MAENKEQAGFVEYLTVLLLFLFLFVVYVIRLYGNPKNFPWHSYVTIFLAYFCSLALLLFVPLDVALTVVSRRDISLDEYDKNSSTLVTMYITVFTPITILSGFLMVIQEYYLRDGHFTVWTRITGLCKMIGLQMIGGAVFGAIFFGILVGEKVVKPNGEAVLLTVVLISNTCYLMVMMLFMGYGLVAFPMHLWQKGDLKRSLNSMEQKAASRYKTLGEASINVGLAVADVMKTKTEVATYTDSELTRYMDIVVKECPTNFTSQTMGKVAYDGNSKKVTVDSLAALRGRLYRLRNAYEMAHGKVEEAKVKAYHYEDIAAAINRTDKVKKIAWSFEPESSEFVFMWEVWYKPILFRLSGIVAAVLSVFSYLGIIGTMPGVSRGLSVYYTAVHDKSVSGGGVCVFVLFTLTYTAYVVLWSIFQMRISNMMELLPNQKTTPNSLSVNARACSKFAAPLCFFYLGWIFENGTKTGKWTNGSNGDEMLTAFANFYQIQLIPVIGDSFNMIFPIIIFSVSFLVLTNTINRFLVMIHCENFQFGSEILTSQQLSEGRRQLARHKRLMERAARRASLREHISTAKGENVVVAAITKPVKNIVSVFLCCKKGNEYDEAVELRDEELGDDDDGDFVPDAMKGWCERKESKSRGFVGGAWQRRYLHVSEPGCLKFYKDAEMDKEMEEMLDLRETTDFCSVEGKDRGTQMNIMLEDGGEIKLRFQHDEDVPEWQRGLMAWKAYSLEHDSLHSEPSSDGTPVGGEVNGLDDIVIGDTGDSPGVAMNPLTPPDSSSKKKNQQASYQSVSSSGKDNYDKFEIVRLESGNMSTPPEIISGWLEKKTHHTGKMGQWQRKYFRILDNGMLAYSTSEKSDFAHSTQIDLKLIVEIVDVAAAKGPDSGRFNIVMDDRVYKLKASCPEEADHWIEGLRAWQEYVLFNMA